MAKHVTTKDLEKLIGNIRDIEYSEFFEDEIINIVKLINDINKRLEYLEEINIKEIELQEDGILLPLEGIRL